jgi:hypothetical protein
MTAYLISLALVGLVAIVQARRPVWTRSMPNIANC